MTYTCIEFSVTDRVALIRLNRPQDGNALTLDMARELLDAATRCEADPGIRVVVLTGVYAPGAGRRSPAALGDVQGATRPDAEPSIRVNDPSICALCGVVEAVRPYEIRSASAVPL